MQTRREQGGITFPVEDVERSQRLLPLAKTRDAIVEILKAANSPFATRKVQVVPVIYCSGYNSNVVKGQTFNGLFAAAHTAFAGHHPLVLSPDIIWTAILQGFAIHVHQNAEELRAMLVPHEGRERIVVPVTAHPASPESDWAAMIAAFSEQLSKRVGLAYNELVSDFSTTGEVERLVCEVTLMDVFEPYYEFVAVCICGIPEVTLEGTPEDWSQLRKKIDCLERYELDWWVPHLRRIADQFYAASCGEIDTVFWQNIYKLKAAYGGDRINGWLGKLVPYLRHHETGKYTLKNPLLEEPDIVPTEPPGQRGFAASGIMSDVLPTGLSQTPLKLNYNGDNYPMELLAGFVGFEQNDQTFALRPKLGWAVRHAGTAPTKFDD